MKIYKDHITNRNEIFERLVVMTQERMKKYVAGRLSNYGKVSQGDGFVYHKGTFPVLLCAHMDTVHKTIPSTLVYANGTISSPQGIGGDDRCGIYMIFKILEKYDCHVVFLEDEEIGCVGAKKFVETKICKKLKNENLKYIIEFDRKGNNHAVTYDCANPEFDNFITKEFFKKEYGTCSDISYIAPKLGIAAVNLSCGYYKEHHLEEWVNLAEMETVIENAMKVLERTKELEKPFEYIESKYCRTWNNNRYGRDYDDYYDYEYGYGYGYYNKGYGYSSLNRNQEDTKKLEIKYKLNNYTYEKTVSGNSYANAMCKFFTDRPYVRFEDIVSVKER